VDVYTMVVSIVALSMGGGVLMKYLEARAKTPGASDADTQAIEQELDDLRSRIQTLEQIVTDEKYQLGRQINEL